MSNLKTGSLTTNRKAAVNLTFYMPHKPKSDGMGFVEFKFPGGNGTKTLYCNEPLKAGDEVIWYGMVYVVAAIEGKLVTLRSLSKEEEAI